MRAASYVLAARCAARTQNFYRKLAATATQLFFRTCYVRKFLQIFLAFSWKIAYNVDTVKNTEREEPKMYTIYFDMDGTIADLYNVENWLPKLRAEDASPYVEAEIMVDASELQLYLKRLRKILR